MPETLKHHIEVAVLAQALDGHGQIRQTSPKLDDPMIIDAYARALVESGNPRDMVGMEASLIFLELIPKEGLTAIGGVSAYKYSQKKGWLEEGYF